MPMDMRVHVNQGYHRPDNVKFPEISRAARDTPAHC